MKERLTGPFRRLVRKNKGREKQVADETDPVQSRIAALRAARDVAGEDADLDEVKELASWMLGEEDEVAALDEGEEEAEEEEADEEPEEEAEEEPEEEPEPPKKRASRSRKKS